MGNNARNKAPIGPLTSGNIITAGVNVYRAHFKQYFKLGFIAYLWLLVPIYGWAEFSAISGSISRLTFNEIIGRPESITEASRHLKPRMWSFFGTGFLVILIVLGAMFVGNIVLELCSQVFGSIFGWNPIGRIVWGVSIAIVWLALHCGYIWIYTGLSIAEVPIAVEPNVYGTKAIARSWELTQGFIFHLVKVYLVTFLLSYWIFIMSYLIIIMGMGAALFFILMMQYSHLLSLLPFLLFPIILALLAVQLPLWQAIKAVIYYDLRTRREALDLQLRLSAIQKELPVS